MSHQDGRQGEPLPLAAGESVDAPLLHAREPRLFESRGHFFRDDFRRLAAIFQRKAHFVAYGHGEKLVIRRLIHRPRQDPDILRRHSAHIPTVQENAPRQLRLPFFQEARDGLDERRFPAARAAGEEHHFSFRYGKIHMRQGFPLARQVAARKVFDFQYHDPITCFSRLPMR